MKDFFKNILATVFGFFLSIGLVIAFFVVSLIGTIASSSGKAVDVQDDTVLLLDLQGEITEKGNTDALQSLFGDSFSSIGLNDILAAIEKAKDNDKIKGIYIKAGLFMSDYASIQEIRAKLADFKKSGKWIVAYSDMYTQKSYYLASVADKVYLNPQGRIQWCGVGAQPTYYKDLLEKVGMKFTVVKVGTYKSATEIFTEEKMSDANRQQMTAFINGTWETVLKEVSASRKISKETLNGYADEFVILQTAQELKKKKLVDDILFADSVKALIQGRLDIDRKDIVNTVSVTEMRSVETPKGKYSLEGENIAVYYCSGDIVMDAEAGMGSMSSTQIVARDVCHDINGLAADDDVKAVVIRINSGGGDAYASEQLWHAITELRKVKPVVVSMGGAAASGGYYMACNASWIIAEPTTLTGSIGIFGMFPDMTDLMTKKLGIRYDEVKTNKNTLFSPAALYKPLNADELDALQAYIDNGYLVFKTRVADGRKMSLDDVEKIAQGRVWLGKDALKIKLVDQLGTLETAISKAAQLAKVKEYHITEFPAEKDFAEQLLEKAAGKGSDIDVQLRSLLGAYYEPFVLVRSMKNQAPVQARIPFVLNIK